MIRVVLKFYARCELSRWSAMEFLVVSGLATWFVGIENHGLSRGIVQGRPRASIHILRAMFANSRPPPEFSYFNWDFL